MTKLTKDDFKEFEDGDYTADNHPHWICVRKSHGGYYVRVSSSDWHDENAGRGTTVDSAFGFDALDEALQWGVDCVNEIPLRLACAALETAFEAMDEWLPLVLPALATARTEAALAERSVCAALVERITEVIDAPGGFVRLFGTDTARTIRARTTPDTLSTDTLAAIAEARGLRVVEPERLAEIEALRAAVDEETALDRERAEHGCGDASCVVERAAGMTTNGGCRCGRRALRAALQKARKQIAELEALRDVPVLRWVADGEPGWSRAEVSGWEVSAGRGNWALTHRSGASKLSPRPNRASEQDNRRHAAAALRSMGVAFRVEEDGAS